jgi:hypothetical protein
VQGADQNGKRADAPDVRWRVTTGSGVQFACCVCITGARIEVRLTTEQDDLVCARVVPSLDAASAVVRGWLHVVVSSNGVSELISASRADVVH